MSSLPLEQTWLILVELLTDLKKRGIEVPTQINEDIRLVKTSINFYKRDTTHPDMIKELKRINLLLNSSQDQLMELAETQGKEYRDQWIQKLTKASLGEEVYKIKDTKSRFMVGAPPGFSSARVNLKEPLAEDRVQEIAENYNLIIEFEEDDIIALYGDSENLKKGLQEIGSFFKE